jgi:hypothetical protein
MMTSRLIDAAGLRRPVASRHSARTGHATIAAIARTMVTSMTRNDDSSANPAPGPM